MTTWQCPSCFQRIGPIAAAIGHKCPSRRNAVVEWYWFTELEDDEDVK